MESKKFNRKNLYVAELKYYDEEANGVEFGQELSLVLLSNFKKGKETIYYNVLNEGEVLPTFGRSTEYGQYDSEGNQYGTKMRHLGGKLQTGLCWVLRHSLENYDYLPEELDRNAIEELVLESDYYFKDRKFIAERMRKERNHPFKMIKILRKDAVDEEYMNFFLQEREEERQKTKK